VAREAAEKRLAALDADASAIAPDGESKP
jgi:hypothetical protein